MASRLPGADLLLSNSYDALVAGVKEAKHIGRGVIDGRECEHLAFRNFDTDWQLWVEVGEKPIPRKLVITSKTLNSAPQYTLRVKTLEDRRSSRRRRPSPFVPPAGREETRPRRPHPTRRTAAGSSDRRKPMTPLYPQIRAHVRCGRRVVDLQWRSLPTSHLTPRGHGKRCHRCACDAGELRRSGPTLHGRRRSRGRGRNASAGRRSGCAWRGRDTAPGVNPPANRGGPRQSSRRSLSRYCSGRG